jgi:two-component system CheB/CheR fusion protein
LFSQIDKKLKIFVKKKDATSKASFEMNYVLSGKEKEAGSFQRNSFSKGKTDDIDLDESVDQLLMKKFTPACVVVNQDLDIIQFRGSTGAFLEPAPGKASLNLLKMARTGLGFELRNIVHKASKSGKEEKKSWTETGKDTKNREISIEAIPIKNDKDSIEKYFLVIFHEGLPEAASETHLSFSRDKRVKQLEAELTGLREDLRSIVESQEAANEELQSVNEEIVSSNEELQSINEELETSKEELESSNEELITINQELQMRNEQLAETQEYSEAVFTTIRESLLILDKNLRVKNANSCFYKTFGATIEETEGKLIYDLGEKQWDIPILRELLEDIIPRNSMVSDFEVRHTFPQLGEKIMLLNARRLVRKLHSEHLILLAIEDITAFRQASQLIAEREEWFHSMADNSPMMIWHTDLHRKNSFVNKAWLEYRNMSFDEAIGKSWLEAGMHPDDKKRVEKVFNDSFSRRTGFTVTYRLIREDRSYRTILSKGEPNYNHAREFTGYIGSCVEIPEDMKPLS